MLPPPPISTLFPYTTLFRSANSVNGQGRNAAGMIVGTSTTSDGTEHAFLYVNGQMYDLNTLCDLTTSNFKVLSSAKSISDSCQDRKSTRLNSSHTVISYAVF